MNPVWRDFLKTQGAQFDTDRLLGFADHAYDTVDNIIADLSHLAIIHISGDDAESFLHGQLTINIKTFANNHFQFAAWCNPKGQVKVTCIIYRYDDGYTILLPDELREIFIRQLQMYILRSDVKIADQSDTLVRLGIQTQNPESFSQLIAAVPDQQGDVTINGSGHCLYLHSGGDNQDLRRYILIGSADSVTNYWKELVPDHCPVATAIWELLDIQAAYPWLSTDSTEKFLPQMLNLDLIDGLNYQKGCYPGQEIIARLHFRGQVKRRLNLATCEREPDPVPDTEFNKGGQLYAGDDKSIGTVINIQAFANKYYLLAIIDVDIIEQAIHLGGIDGPVLNIELLPYATLE